MRTGLLLAAGAAIAVAVVSRSLALPRSARDADSGYTTVRASLDVALDRARVHLEDLSAEASEGSDEGLAALRADIEELEARRIVIVQALDSMSAESDETWRGAVPGIRASLSELETRIDRVAIEVRDSAGDGELLAEWLDDMERRIESIERAEDADETGGWTDDVATLRQQRDEIEQRLHELARTDNDPGLRAGLVDELIALRRRLRAIERATGALLRPRYP